MNKKLVPLVLLVALGAAFFFWQKNAAAKNPALLTLYGNVDVREVEMAFRGAGGRLSVLAVDEGAQVAAGDLLAELDAQPFRDAFAAAAAEVQRAQAELDKLEHGNRPQEIERAAAQLRQAEAFAARASADRERQEGLAATGAASQKVLEAARAAQAESAAAVEAARQTYALLEAGFRREDIAVAKARLAVAEAARAQAETALADCRLLAPERAVVASRLREVGSLVTSRDAVYTLSLRDPVYVRAYVGEKDLGRIAPGTPVRIKTDASEKVFAGEIGFISPKAEFTPKAVETTDLRTALVYRLRIVVKESGDSLRHGMPVTVEIDRGSATAAKEG